MEARGCDKNFFINKQSRICEWKEIVKQYYDQIYLIWVKEE